MTLSPAVPPTMSSSSRLILDQQASVEETRNPLRPLVIEVEDWSRMRRRLLSSGRPAIVMRRSMAVLGEDHVAAGDAARRSARCRHRANGPGRSNQRGRATGRR